MRAPAGEGVREGVDQAAEGSELFVLMDTAVGAVARAAGALTRSQEDSLVRCPSPRYLEREWNLVGSHGEVETPWPSKHLRCSTS